MPRLIAWFATNHIAANLLLILIVLAGLSAVLTMPQKSFPDIDVPIISVSIPSWVLPLRRLSRAFVFELKKSSMVWRG